MKDRAAINSLNVREIPLPDEIASLRQNQSDLMPYPIVIKLSVYERYGSRDIFPGKLVLNVLNQFRES